MVVAAALALRAAPARAQASDPDLRPTRGPFITDAARAGDADATAVELNPGALGFVPGGTAEIVGAGADSGATIARRGGGLYLAAPAIGSSTLGLGFTYVSSTADEGVDAHTTLRIAYALRLGRSLALGAAWAHIWGGAFEGIDTFDVGLSARAGRHVALGVTVEDLNQPHPGARATELPRLWTAELALRPLGTDRVELALGAAHENGDAWARLVPRARVAVRIADGLGAYAQAERVPAYGDGAFSNLAYTDAGVGLTVDLDHLGGALGVHGLFAGTGSAPAGATGGAPAPASRSVGIAGRAHIDVGRRAAVAAPAYVARVKLGGIDDDRAFFTLTRRLRALAVDPGVLGVVFEIRDVELSMGRIEEVRELMAVLRAHGKRTFAHAPFASTREYYLAAGCDAVLLHPAGALALTGLAQNVTFYKGAMDRIGVRVELVRVGAYKGAMEPFVMTEQSPSVRANKNQLLDDVFARVVAAIAADRTRAGHPMDAAETRALIDRGLFSPGEAQLAGLADAIVGDDGLDAYLARALGRARVDVRDPDAAPEQPSGWPGRRVAVVLVDGAITDGKSEELPFGAGASAGADTLVDALDHCRRDASVAAVVLRVNSPGGSAFASDVIARAVKQLRAVGKPVIVSMGDLAASGGYYIAAAADEIFAEPSTISGSIGIFGFKVDVRDLLTTLGVSVESYRRGARADFFSPYRAWTADEQKVANEQIRHLYGLFIDTVAEGRRARGLTLARVDEIGRGQVWTGAMAQGLGLVDKIGGLGAAIDEAARRGAAPLGRDQLPEIELLPRAPGGVLRHLAGLASAAAADTDALAPSVPPETIALPAALLGPDSRAVIRLVAPLLLGPSTGVQARLPYDIDIR